MKRKIKHSGSLTLWHFRNKDAHLGKCQSAIVPYNIYPSYWDHYCSPRETHTLILFIRHRHPATGLTNLLTVEQRDAVISLFSDGLAGCLCKFARFGRRSPKNRVFLQTNGVVTGTKAAPPKQIVPPDTLDKVRSLIRSL